MGVNGGNAKSSVLFGKSEESEFLLWHSFPSPVASSKLLPSKSQPRKPGGKRAFPTRSGDRCPVVSRGFLYGLVPSLLIFSPEPLDHCPLLQPVRLSRSSVTLVRHCNVRANFWAERSARGSADLWCAQYFQQEIPAASPHTWEKAFALKLFPCLFITSASVTPIGRKAARGQSRGPPQRVRGLFLHQGNNPHTPQTREAFASSLPFGQAGGGVSKVGGVGWGREGEPLEASASWPAGCFQALLAGPVEGWMGGRSMWGGEGG